MSATSTTADSRRSTTPTQQTASTGSTGFASSIAGKTTGPRPAERGRLVVADKVVAKIAGQAAAEVTGAVGRSGGLLSIGDSADEAARPKVQVELAVDSADLHLQLGVTYPGSIRQTTQRVRERVTTRVQELTGISVHRVDIDVTFLTSEADAGSAHGSREVLR